MPIRNFFKKEETQADKVRAEIESMEFKKTSILQVVLNEKATCETNIQQILYKMGLEVYNKSKKGDENYDFSEYIAEINAIEETVSQKNSKIAEITNRYDEEISLLKENLKFTEAPTQVQPTTVQTPTPPVQAVVDVGSNSCSSCGTTVGTGDLFCQSCGTKI